jgi:hypothetical protein
LDEASNTKVRNCRTIHHAPVDELGEKRTGIESKKTWIEEKKQELEEQTAIVDSVLDDLLEMMSQSSSRSTEKRARRVHAVPCQLMTAQAGVVRVRVAGRQLLVILQHLAWSSLADSKGSRQPQS